MIQKGDYQIHEVERKRLIE